MQAPSRLTPTYPEVRRTGAGLTLQISHAHAELELNFVLSGRGTLFLDDAQYELRPGALVWLLPQQNHRLMRSPDLDMWVVTLSPTDYDQALLDDVAQVPTRVLSQEDAIALDRLLTHVSQDSDNAELYRSGIHYAVRSARHLSMTGAAPARKPLHPAVRKALMLLRSPDEVPSAADLARMCGVKRDYLAHLLVEQTGRGIVEWRNRARLERFHILFPESEDLLTAAFAAGFGSYAQFHRVFVELVGTTPGAWAKSGARASTLSVLAASQSLPGLEGGTSRMIWLPLTEISLPAVRRWMGPEFGPSLAALLARSTPPQDACAIESHIAEVADLRRNADELVGGLALEDASSAQLLQRAFATNDVFHAYEGTLGAWGLGFGDVASLAAMYIGLAEAAANHTPPFPTRNRLRELTVAIRAAAAETGAFSAAGPQDRARAATALVAQSLFLRQAIYAALSSGSERALLRVSDAAHRTALATVGLDLREHCKPQIVEAA